MSSLTLTFTLLIGAYVIFLVAAALRRRLSPCSYCLATVTTWLVLLILSVMDIVNTPIVIAIIMGQSSLGFFSKLKERAPNIMPIIQLPYFLSAIWIIALVLGGWGRDFIGTGAMTLVAWVVCLLLLAYRQHTGTRRLVDRLLACCKNL